MCVKSSSYLTIIQFTQKQNNSIIAAQNGLWVRFLNRSVHNGKLSVTNLILFNPLPFSRWLAVPLPIGCCRCRWLLVLLLKRRPIRFSNRHLLGAQILSLVAFFLSLAGWWLAWVSGLIVVIALWVACCIPYPRVLWIIIAILSAIAAIGEILVVAGAVDENLYCGGDKCSINKAGAIVMSVIAILSWIGVGYVAWIQHDGSGRTSEDLPR